MINNLQSAIDMAKKQIKIAKKQKRPKTTLGNLHSPETLMEESLFKPLKDYLEGEGYKTELVWVNFHMGYELDIFID